MFNIYIIRSSSFGENFDTKLYMSIAMVIMVIIDYSLTKRKDLLYTAIIGSIIWSMVEGIAQISSIRVIPNKILFGNQIPLWASVILQGISEGAFVSVLGLFFADRMIGNNKKSTVIISSLIFSVFMLFILISSLIHYNPEPNIGGDVASRRNLFTLPSILLMGSAIFINLIWTKKLNKYAKKRVILMLILMGIFGAAWDIGEVLANNRWVEVGFAPDNLQRAPLIIEIIAHAYDIIIEFSLFFLVFLAIPDIFKLIDVNKSSLEIYGINKNETTQSN